MWKELIGRLYPWVEFGEPASDAEIDQIEQQLGQSVPDDLRDLLRQADGVEPQTIWSGRVSRSSPEIPSFGTMVTLPSSTSPSINSCSSEATAAVTSSRTFGVLKDGSKGSSCGTTKPMSARGSPVRSKITCAGDRAPRAIRVTSDLLGVPKRIGAEPSIRNCRVARGSKLPPPTDRWVDPPCPADLCRSRTRFWRAVFVEGVRHRREV